MTASVIVPTLNAARDWAGFAPALLACVAADQVLIVDSSSTDGTDRLAREAGFRVHTIPRAEFSHGGTRQMAAELLVDSDILVYLTQDAVLSGPEAVRFLLRAFESPSVGAAYGRQLPRPGATPIERHARLFNYPGTSGVRCLANRDEMGIKSIFLSNSFAAYRRDALLECGGFQADVIFGEDTVLAARLLLAGWKIAYVSEAKVHHSHAYGLVQEFKRYFDIGVLHRREQWMLDEFGRAGGEGRRFVLSEVAYLAKTAPWLIPSAVARTALKLLGYRLGRLEDRLGVRLKRSLSMHRAFWG